MWARRHHSVIADHVWINSHVVISDNVSVASYSWLGVNCALLANVKIGEGSVVQLGAVVSSDTAAYTMYTGNPACESGPSDVPRVMDALP